MYFYGSYGSYAPQPPIRWCSNMPITPGTQYVCLSTSQMEFRDLQRTLWEQHVAWTRLAIVRLVFGLPDTDAVVARLLQNAPDMGNSIKPFYGVQAGDTYSGLIKDHLVIASELIKAAKAGDTAAAAAAEKRWYANADQIVEFLSQLNPYFPKDAFRKMFYEHLALTKAEAVTMLQKDYTSSIQLYDRIEREALMMADMISAYLYR